VCVCAPVLLQASPGVGMGLGWAQGSSPDLAAMGGRGFFCFVVGHCGAAGALDCEVSCDLGVYSIIYHCGEVGGREGGRVCM
jgi:hypothetical protein